MNFLSVVFLAQLAVSARQDPALSLPQPGLDDTASYGGYQTRFYRDAARNTVQIYIDGRSGRVVHLLANADNESIGFTGRGPDGAPAALAWDADGAEVTETQGFRTLSYQLAADVPQVTLGWFLLGSMRVERDFQYWDRHRQPFGAPAFSLAETDSLLSALQRLEAGERARHLAMLRAPNVEVLRGRLRPRMSVAERDSILIARVVQLSLDGQDSLAVEVRVDTRRVAAARAGDSLTLRARTGRRIPFTIAVSSTAEALTPLSREEIFRPEFLAFVAGARDTAPLLERQVRGVELLASREKLMAGLPAYATYFGRDMLVSALMMRPIWRSEVSEFVIGSVLRRLSPDGQVSHEEALGGQAVREAAAEYSALVTESLRAAREGRRVRADSLLARARAVLGDHRRVRENYHMIDDEFQFVVLAARWLADPEVTAARKRAFLMDRSDLGEPRLDRLVRQLALVARMTEPYAANASAMNLVPFAPRDSGRWSSASWRDSGAGYAGGRFAMDVNAIWVPHALESLSTILRTLPEIGIALDSLGRAVPELAASTPLGRYARDRQALRRATETWWTAERHFLVRLTPSEIRARVTARLGELPPPERAYWTSSPPLARTGADRDALTFLALALDGDGRPLAVANTDPATRLFLGERPSAGAAAATEAVLRDVRLFVRAYPVGLFIDGVGPVVANDAYATPAIWNAFERDRYHGPRVVWGREVNLFLLGVARHIANAPPSAGAAYARELRAAFDAVSEAAEASGFQSELWSYEVQNGRMVPVRYGTGSDVQLWSTTDLAVQFALSRLPP